MGYYTQYKLSHDGDKIAELDGVLTQVTGYNWKGLDIGDSVKWYDFDVDMRKISKMFPFTLFTLCGEGEESGDIWKAYYKDGKCQHVQAKVVFEEFDEERLK